MDAIESKVELINYAINGLDGPSRDQLSDGYHTFGELYDYRMIYNAALFNEWAAALTTSSFGRAMFRYVKFNVQKSKRHHDGEECFGGGWFIVQAQLPQGQISNHYPMKYWDLFKVPEVDKADEWDGHTPQEAFERLMHFIKECAPYRP